jgi:hypothetical protein
LLPEGRSSTTKAGSPGTKPQGLPALGLERETGF